MTHEICLFCVSWKNLGYAGCVRHMTQALRDEHVEEREIQEQAQRFLDQQGDADCDPDVTYGENPLTPHRRALGI